MLGRPTISWPAVLLAKIGVAVSMWLLFTAAYSRGPRLPVPILVMFSVLLDVGACYFVAGLLRLGSNLRVGLPSERTELVTSGIYRISRNPIYAGIFSLMGASLVYAFSWLNLAAVAVSVFLHHRIVLAEERFLALRFAGYADYRQRVRRYF